MALDSSAHKLEFEQPQQKKPEKGEKLDEKEFKKGLTPMEIQRLNRKQTSIKDLVAQRDQLARSADLELNNLIRQRDVVDLNEYKNFQNQIKKTKSPEKMRELLEKMKNLPKEKEQKAEKEKEEEKPLELDDPKLKEHTDKIFKKLDDSNVINWIGTKQKDPFKKYFEEEIRKNPTIKNAKELYRKLEEDRNGLKPRQEFFEKKLAPKLKKYGVDISDAEYLKAEGLSERQTALTKIEEAEKKIDGMKETGLYSVSAKKKIIKEMLKEKDPQKLHEMHQSVLDTTRKEAEQFTDQRTSVFKNTMVKVNGITFHAMSDKSIQFFLDDYKEYDMETRASTVVNWEKIAENEGKLFEKLGELYKDDVEGFKEAGETFENLDFVAKQEFIKKQEKLKKNNSPEKVRESNEIQKKSVAEIEKARAEKTLSSKTAREFKKWATDIENFSDPKTGKIDLKKQQELHDKLTSPEPIFEKKNRNIAAYKSRRLKYIALQKKFAKDNPEYPGEELKERMQEYDESSYHERKELYQTLKEEYLEKERERRKNKEREEKLDIDDEDKETAEKNDHKRNLVMESASEALESGEKKEVQSALRAIYFYLAFTDSDINDDEELKDVRTQLEELQQNIGNEKDSEKTLEEKLEREAEELAKNEQETKKDILEEQITSLNIEGVEQSQRKHAGTVSAEKRAQKESIQDTEAGSLEREFTEQFYEESKTENVLNEEGKAEEITEIKIGKKEMTDQERASLKQETYDEQGKLNTHEGFLNELVDAKTGRVMSAQEAEAKQQIEQEKKEDILAEKMIENVQATQKNEGLGSDVFDLTARIAAQRKAREKFEEKTDKKLAA